MNESNPCAEGRLQIEGDFINETFKRVVVPMLPHRGGYHTLLTTPETAVFTC
jgi:hypothetical protein